MNDTDYIKAGVELADGFRWLHRDKVEIRGLNNAVLHPFSDQWFLDALAAQLVRQVDATDYGFESHPDGTALIHDGEVTLLAVDDSDRTMNTLKCVVDSKVLT